MGNKRKKVKQWQLLSREVSIPVLLCNSTLKLSYMLIEMQVTEEEMAEAKVPLNLRDYCAHLFIPLMICRKDNYYLPWKCKKEKHAWDDCQYQE